MNKQELIELLRSLCQGRMDCVEPLAEVLMNEPKPRAVIVNAPDDKPPKHEWVREALEIKPEAKKKAK